MIKRATCLIHDGSSVELGFEPGTLRPKAETLPFCHCGLLEVEGTNENVQAVLIRQFPTVGGLDSDTNALMFQPHDAPRGRRPGHLYLLSPFQSLSYCVNDIDTGPPTRPPCRSVDEKAFEV
ncbi:hypothetical protein AVEN_137315-1 [Araneus ventricosus]|uniref:Uncharacterized protein n=1 Tax=Araneus ventricosus TaxID=182803 RepID=A0A4Y2FJW1_ARAVE|nr:hypothetical protein AVEN_137315-1 [Araneus ventricosus]